MSRSKVRRLTVVSLCAVGTVAAVLLAGFFLRSQIHETASAHAVLRVSAITSTAPQQDPTADLPVITGNGISREVLFDLTPTAALLVDQRGGTQAEYLARLKIEEIESGLKLTASAPTASEAAELTNAAADAWVSHFNRAEVNPDQTVFRATVVSYA